MSGFNSGLIFSFYDRLRVTYDLLVPIEDYIQEHRIFSRYFQIDESCEIFYPCLMVASWVGGLRCFYDQGGADRCNTVLLYSFFDSIPSSLVVFLSSDDGFLKSFVFHAGRPGRDGGDGELLEVPFDFVRSVLDDDDVSFHVFDDSDKIVSIRDLGVF